MKGAFAMRFAAAAFFAGLVVFAMRLPAPAMAETCPASVDDLHAINGSLYSFDLGAGGTRTVAGDIAVETNVGWFRIQFAEQPIAPETRHYRGRTGEVVKNVFVSPVLYMQFPEAVGFLNLWVESGKSSGEKAGSETQSGAFTCFPPQRLEAPAPHATPDPAQPVWDPRESAALQASPTASSTVLTAKAVPPIESTACAQPFAEARIVHLEPPVYPFLQRMPRSISLVRIVVLPDGSVGDVRVYQSSSIAAFDIAAMDAARRSTYLPAIAYCKPTIGAYLFRASFLPR